MKWDKRDQKLAAISKFKKEQLNDVMRGVKKYY